MKIVQFCLPMFTLHHKYASEFFSEATNSRTTLMLWLLMKMRMTPSLEPSKEKLQFWDQYVHYLSFYRILGLHDVVLNWVVSLSVSESPSTQKQKPLLCSVQAEKCPAVHSKSCKLTQCRFKEWFLNIELI